MKDIFLFVLILSVNDAVFAQDKVDSASRLSQTIDRTEGNNADIWTSTGVLSIGNMVFSQGRIDSAYRLFPTIDWTEWNNVDTGVGTGMEQKNTTRLRYAALFDKLLVKGISKDTVEKYLGIGGNFEYAGDSPAWRVEAHYKHKMPGNYCIVYDYKRKEWISKIRVYYKKGKVVKYTRHAFYY